MKLNDNYRIVYDSDNTILQFFEQREVNVKDEFTKKYVGTGKFKEHTENFYYPNLKTALNGFLNKCTWGLETAEQVLTEIKKTESLINQILINEWEVKEFEVVEQPNLFDATFNNPIEQLNNLY